MIPLKSNAFTGLNRINGHITRRGCIGQIRCPNWESVSVGIGGDALRSTERWPTMSRVHLTNYYFGSAENVLPATQPLHNIAPCLRRYGSYVTARVF